MTGRGDWLVPDWPAPPGVRAAFSLRSGGASAAPYDSMNLGDHVGDEPQAVAANRGALAAALGARPVFLQQVHGTGVVELRAGLPDATQADACLTSGRALACTIMVADCLPVLFADTNGRAVAAAHAGWRGLAGVSAAGAAGRNGILECTHEQFVALQRASIGSSATKTIAWLGPCIGPEAFEVGPDVKRAFENRDPGDGVFFRPRGPGKWLADLPGLARRRLNALGIDEVHGNDGSAAWCTVANPSRFFSHRRDRVSGRMAACVWLEG